MYGVSVYSTIALWLALIFGLIGAVQLVGPRFVREAYRRWDYSERVRLLTGVLDILAAIMLATPAWRGWGIALAAVLTFGSVVVFLSHRQYPYAVPTIGLMIALVPATVAVPRPVRIQFVVQTQTAAERTQTAMASGNAVSSNVAVQGAGSGDADRRTF